MNSRKLRLITLSEVTTLTRMITDHCAFCASTVGNLEDFFALPVELGGGLTDSNLVKVCGLHSAILQQVRSGMGITSPSDSEQSQEITKLKHELEQSHARLNEILYQKKDSSELIKQQAKNLDDLQSAHYSLKHSLEIKEGELFNAKVIIEQLEAEASHANLKLRELETKFDNASKKINELEVMLSALSEKNDSLTGTDDPQLNEEFVKSNESVPVQEQSSVPNIMEFGLSDTPLRGDSKGKAKPLVSEEEIQSTIDAFDGDLVLAAEVLGVNYDEFKIFADLHSDPLIPPLTYDSISDLHADSMESPLVHESIKENKHGLQTVKVRKENQHKQLKKHLKVANVRDCQVLHKALELGVHFNKDKVVIEQVGNERISMAMKNNDWSVNLFRDKEKLKELLRDVLLCELSEQNATTKTVSRGSGIPVEYIQQLLMHAEITDAKTTRVKTSKNYSTYRYPD